MIKCRDCGETNFNEIYKESFFCDICVEAKAYEYYGIKPIPDIKDISSQIRFYEGMWIKEAKKNDIHTINRTVIKKIIEEVNENGVEQVKEILMRGIENEKADTQLHE